MVVAMRRHVMNAAEAASRMQRLDNRPCRCRQLWRPLNHRGCAETKTAVAPGAGHDFDRHTAQPCYAQNNGKRTPYNQELGLVNNSNVQSLEHMKPTRIVVGHVFDLSTRRQSSLLL